MNTEIDIINSITDLLRNAGHPNPTFWLSDSDVKIAIEQPNDSKFKRIYINRFWRRYIGQLSADTIQIRYCLNDDDEINSYLQYFNLLVIPFIIKYQ